MTVEQYAERMEVAQDAADRALDIGDMETHIEWGKAYHQLAEACKRQHGVDLRPEAENRR